MDLSIIEKVLNLCTTDDPKTELSSDEGFLKVCDYASTQPEKDKIIYNIYKYLSQYRHYDLTNYKTYLTNLKSGSDNSENAVYYKKIFTNNYKVCYKILSLFLYYSMFKKFTYKQLYNIEMLDKTTNSYIDFISNKLILRDSTETIYELDPKFVKTLKEILDKRNLKLLDETVKSYIFLSLKSAVITNPQLLSTQKKYMMKLPK